MMSIEPIEIETEFTKEELAADYIRGAIQALDGEEYCTACKTYGSGIYIQRVFPAMKNPIEVCANCGQLKNYNDLTTLLDRYVKVLETM